VRLKVFSKSVGGDVQRRSKKMKELMKIATGHWLQKFFSRKIINPKINGQI
jgi:hypothetical protein